MDKKYWWILIDEYGVQHLEYADDLDELYRTCDYFIQDAIKLDSYVVETLIEGQSYEWKSN